MDREAQVTAVFAAAMQASLIRPTMSNALVLDRMKKLMALHDACQKEIPKPGPQGYSMGSL